VVRHPASRLNNLIRAGIKPPARFLLKGTMKKLFITAGFAIGIILVAMAADPRGRADIRMLSGAKNFVQDEMDREKKPVFVLNSLYYNAINTSDGVILVRSNATVIVHIGLPNPTNNVGRKYQITTMGASTAILSNSTAVGDFTEMTTMANSATYSIASNKTAIVYSTGTNWVARVY